jgi:NADH-quinone oxidoreductase subunit A
MEIREYIAIATAISGIICVASYVLAVQKPETEKAAPYQCGFDAFMDARHKFEIRFYLVAILFIIFDLEISLLFPWAMVINQENYAIIMAFIGILGVGLVYEWRLGGMEWE